MNILILQNEIVCTLGIKAIRNQFTPFEKDMFLTDFFKQSNVSHNRIFFGKEFQRDGADTEKDL